MQIFPVPAFNDNYFWLIQPDSAVSSTYIVDPGSAEPVLAVLKSNNFELAGILVTHHHNDHIGGVAELAQQFGIPVYGPKSVKIPQVSHIVADGDELKLGSLTARVFAIPGHTLDHIAYYFEPHQTSSSLSIDEPPRLFSGDTIFAAGCGRLFDGTAFQLFNSLQWIATLPPETLIYAAHEYTLANIQFALHVEPENSDLLFRRDIEAKKRQNGLPTLPTTLDQELRTNPFMRCHLDQVRHRIEELTGQKSSLTAETFASLRRLKDQF